MKKYIKIISLAAAGIIVFFYGLILTIPEDFIKDAIKKELQETTGFVFTEKEFKKLLLPPIGIEMRQVSFAHELFEKPVLSLDRLQVKFNPIYLFMGRVKIVVAGNKGQSSLSGDILLKGKNTDVNLWANNIDAGTISSLNPESAAPAITARFNGKIKITFQQGECPYGTVTMEGKDIDIGKFKISGFSIPFGEEAKATFSAELKDCKIKVKNLWLDNKEFSANIHGAISLINPYTKSPIALTLEIMPHSSFIRENNYLLSILMNYRKSANYYLMNIRGTIESPVLSQ
ncbi:MAG: type II secretion system protein GspN [Deltaproteobacteria bacterium]|nr:type II secretion system protein GspN [Deltaproteobacteria bacterium]